MFVGVGYGVTEGVSDVSFIVGEGVDKDVKM